MWGKVLLVSNMNIDKSCKTFLGKFDSLLLHLCTFRKISENKSTYKDKPWISSAYQKSISVKNHLIQLKRLI